MGYLTSLQPARMALRAAQLALDVISHNVANANTAGYSRQVAHLSASDPYFSTGVASSATGYGAWVGTGVNVDSINRIHDVFLDVQIRNQLAPQGQLQVTNEININLDRALGEPEGGLSNAMATFFAALQSASNQPQSQAARQSLLNAALTLTDTFHQLSADLSGERSALNGRVGATVTEINATLQGIAQLNERISAGIAAGASPNDLLDARDQLLDKVSALSGARYSIGDDGMATVTLGGKPLVIANQANLLTTQVGVGGMLDVIYQPDLTLATITSGSLRGLLDGRDSTITSLQSDIDAIAASVVTSLNALHVNGFGQLDNPTVVTTPGAPPAFASITPSATPSLRVGSWSISTTAAGNISAVFTPVGGPAEAAITGTITAGGTNTTLIPGLTLQAPGILNNATDTVTITGPNRNMFNPALTNGANITLDAAILADARNFALSDSSNAPADGANGTRLSAVARALTMGGASQTFGQFWQGRVANLGSAAASTKGRLATSNSSVEQLTSRRDQISSVSLDEEGVDMIRYQRAYQAAARIISVQDEMIASLLGSIR